MDEAPSAAVGELHARQVPQVVVGVFNDAPERINDPGDLTVWVILPLCDPTIGGNQLDQMTGHIITMLPCRAIRCDHGSQAASVVVAEPRRGATRRDRFDDPSRLVTDEAGSLPMGILDAHQFCMMVIGKPQAHPDRIRGAQKQSILPLRSGDATARIRDAHWITLGAVILEGGLGAIGQGCAHKPVQIIPRTVNRASSRKVRVRQSPSLVIAV